MPKTEAAAPVAGVEARLARLRELGREDKYREIIEQFKDEDISAWRPAFGADKHRADDMTGVGYDTRGRAYAGLGNLVAAERDLKLAVEISPPNGYFWNDLAQVYRELGKVDAAAGAYVKAVEMDRVDMGKKVYGWMALGATINGARLFAEQMKYDEALKLLALWDDEDIQKMGRGQGAGILRMYGEIYAGMGREEESLAKYKAALELERK